MNQQQTTGQLWTLVAVGGPLAAWIISKTGISQSDYAMFLEIAAIAIPYGAAAFRSWWRNREDTQIAITKNLPSVSRVVVSDSVDGSIREMAHSNDVPNIVTESQNRVDVKAGAA